MINNLFLEISFYITLLEKMVSFNPFERPTAKYIIDAIKQKRAGIKPNLKKNSNLSENQNKNHSNFIKKGRSNSEMRSFLGSDKMISSKFK